MFHAQFYLTNIFSLQSCNCLRPIQGTLGQWKEKLPADQCCSFWPRWNTSDDPSLRHVKYNSWREGKISLELMWTCSALFWTFLLFPVALNLPSSVFLQVVITYLSFLCSRLLDLRQETRAARLIQSAWRNYRLKRELKLSQVFFACAIFIASTLRNNKWYKFAVWSTQVC